MDFTFYGFFAMSKKERVYKSLRNPALKLFETINFLVIFLDVAAGLSLIWHIINP